MVEVIDGICGSGKTTTVIELIRTLTIPTGYGSRIEDRFIFVTPYIMEAHRIAGSIPIDIPKEHAESFVGYEISEYSEFDEGINKAPRKEKSQIKGEKDKIIYRDNAPTNRNFVLPQSKGKGILDAVKGEIEDCNDIVITHTTFENFDTEILDLIKNTIDVVKYRLIIDETPNVFEMLDQAGVNITQNDINTLYEWGNLAVDENDLVSWVETDKVKQIDAYIGLKKLCDEKKIVQYSNTDGHLILMSRQLVDTFKVFKSVHILTYLFEGSVCKSYFDLYQIEYQVMKQHNSRTDKIKYWELISIHNHQNDIVNSFTKYSLSKSWYIRNIKTSKVENLKKVTSNFFNNDRETSLSDRLWTVFKDYKGRIGSKGYKSRFLALNSRATNAHQHVKSMAYLVNLYPNSPIGNYFDMKSHPIDKDKYALAEMIQWIFRSQIRNGQPIKIFIPSKRMRKLLEDWMEVLKREFVEANL